MKHTTRVDETEARRIYPGADVDASEDNTVDTKEVKEDVKELNNNPRDNSLDE
ncbi:MAG: hypothetical protein HDS75_03760 [Bacteroidales bacterium]|nr:hypothetical protein [Bacteroidales bacterium]MDE6802800.1 hypothetical protein [Muribaculaceae bacterium]MDE6832511.1 hypothetical protein [Muribaculaceae bacterium]